MTPRTRSDVEAALWSGWLLTGWPMGSAAVVVWLLRTLGGPHRVGLPVVALAAVGIALAVLALPLAARLLITGLASGIGQLIAPLRPGLPVVDSQPTTITTPTTVDVATGPGSEPQQTAPRRTPAADDGMSRTR
jgi:hypothetical protein